jgi:hypothetical protein
MREEMHFLTSPTASYDFADADRASRVADSTEHVELAPPTARAVLHFSPKAREPVAEPLRDHRGVVRWIAGIAASGMLFS